MGIVFGSPEANRIARQIKELERMDQETATREVAKQEGAIRRSSNAPRDLTHLRGAAWATASRTRPAGALLPPVGRGFVLCKNLHAAMAFYTPLTRGFAHPTLDPPHNFGYDVFAVIGEGHMEFGRAVRVMRAVRGVSQKALAAQIGVNGVVLWQVENGSLPREYVQQQIREALRWTPEMDAALDVLECEPVAVQEAGEPA